MDNQVVDEALWYSRRRSNGGGPEYNRVKSETMDLLYAIFLVRRTRYVNERKVKNVEE